MSKQTDNKFSYRDRVLALEREILDEEGIYSPPDIFVDPNCPYEKCMYCGYDIIHADEALRVDATGDTIHKGCWQDYAEDNIYELCTPVSSV